MAALGAQTLLIVASFIVCGLGPGLLLVRRLRWSPLEKLCGAVAASLLLVYLVSLIAFWLHLPPAVHWAYTFCCPLLAVWRMPDLLRPRRARSVLLAYGLLALWTFALLALARHYAGGTWSFDWLAYYRKTLALLESTPQSDAAKTMLLDRPPGECLIAAHFLAMADSRFENFQLVFLLLNTLVFLPCCLLVRGKRSVPRIAMLFMLNPLLMQNATYTWTKLLAAFYVIAGIAFYLAAMRKRDSVRLTWSAGMLAMGCLVHVSAAPYAGFVALHAIVKTVRGQWPGWRAMIGALVAGAAVLATWFGWVFVNYGADAAAKNPTVPFFRRFTVLENAQRIASNIVNTIAPYPLLITGPRFQQPSKWGQLRDLAFMLYEGNLFAAMGSIGGIVIAILVWRKLRRSTASPMRASCLTAAAVIVLVLLLFVAPIRSVAFVALPTLIWAIGGSAFAVWVLARSCSNWRNPALAALTHEQTLWRAFLIIVPLVGMAAQDRASEFGLTQIWLQPIVLMGVTLLASTLPTVNDPARWLIAVGSSIDFLIGILLHFSLEHVTFDHSNGGGLLPQAQINWHDKQDAGLMFWGDHFNSAAALTIQVALVIGAAMIAWRLLRSRRLNGIA